MIPDDETPAGPFDRPMPFVASSAVWDPANIPDGSSVQVDLATGELIRIPPSETRRRRLEARQRQHEARLEAERAEAAAAARRGAALARAALPPKPTPIGLIRDRQSPLTMLKNRQDATESTGQTA